MSFRKLSVSLGAGLLALASAAALMAPAPRSALGSDGAEQMRRASAYVDSLVRTTRGVRDASRIPAATAVALGYLERLRLGLGSPFRLVDYALHDPRLDDSTRTRVAWALLDHTMRGGAYVVNPVVLDAVGPFRDGAAAAGDAHVALIEHAIAAAPDAREGELAVRLAYELAVGERTLDAPALPIATEVAALTRDRRLARADVQTLFERARADRIPVLDELQGMRADHEFAVEQPASSPVSSASEARAVTDARALLDSIRALGGAGAARVDAHPAHTGPLGAAAARRLASVGAALPFQSPVAVAVRSYRGALLGGVAGRLASDRQRFTTGAQNEETLAALYVEARSAGDSAAAPALAVTAAATALRAYAQEAVWFPGDGGPTRADLEREFGLASVTFDPDVPAAWRPYYRRLLWTGILDVQRVLTGLSVQGLHIHYSIGGLPDSALAMHNPATRTIRLSIRSSAGTLAHELSHDLDWQAGQRLYASGGYSTDHAAEVGDGPLSWSVSGLAAARLVNPQRGAPAPNETDRPAELFARDMDWFVAQSLASLGRSDGYLSSVQDAALTGYAGATADMTPRAALALMSAAQQMTYVPEALRERYLAEWTDPAEADPYLLVQRVLAAHPAFVRGGPGWSGREAWMPRLGAAPLVCVDVPANASEALRTRATLIDLALDARARGIARMRAGWYPESRRPAWARGILDEAPWARVEAERAVRRIRAGLAAQLASGADATPFEQSFPAFRVSAQDCSD